MSERPWVRGGRVHWVGCALAVAGCDSGGTPAGGNDASADGQSPSDGATDTGPDAPRGYDAGASPASTRAAIVGDAGAPLDGETADVGASE